MRVGLKNWVEAADNGHSRGASNISENPPDSDMPAAHGRDRLDGWSSPVSLTPRTA